MFKPIIAFMRSENWEVKEAILIENSTEDIIRSDKITTMTGILEDNKSESMLLTSRPERIQQKRKINSAAQADFTKQSGEEHTLMV